MKHATVKRCCVLNPLVLFGLAVMLARPATSLAQYYESYFLFHGAHPDNEGTPYADEFQGLTHDKDNWFLCSNGHDDNGNKVPQLWKVPVQYNLKDVTGSAQWPGVICRRISETPLAQLGYSHFGDISYYKSNGVGYVIVPVEYENRSYALPNVIALFTADTLGYVGKISVPDFPADNDPAGRSFGWIAVDTSGYLYASGDGVPHIFEFFLDWSEVPSGSMTLYPMDTIALFNENGVAIEMGRVQGGVFSESGRLLYLLSGSEDSEHQWPWDGINVFDTRTWRRVIRSTNGSGHFNYKYDWGFSSYNEPEGLTIWDLDDGRAPGISGQLHVGMLNNELGTDNVTLYHYINTIYVDLSYTSEETGEPQKPFNTVGEANNLAWEGARVKVQAGSYSEALTFAKGIQLLAKGGAARIGTIGRLSLTTSAAVNMYGNGTLKLYGQ
jgi:hypothetical protein